MRRSTLFLPLLILIASLASACKTHAPMKKILETYLADPQSEDFQLKYQIGNAFAGMTELTLYGDTGYRLKSTVTKGRKEEEFAGYLEQQQTTAMVQALFDAKPWSLPDNPSRVPDQVRPRFSVRLGTEEATVALWQAELEDHPGYAAAVAHVNALIRTISKGLVLEH